MRVQLLHLSVAISVTFLLAVDARSALVVVHTATDVGPGTTVTNDMATTLVDIGGTVLADFDNYFFSVDDSANHALAGSVNAADLPFSDENRVFFRESEAAMVPDPAGMRSGVADLSSMFIASVSHNFFRDVRTGSATAGFLSGAQMGPDNWVYFSNNDSGNMFPSFWTQLNVSSTSVTPILYVHDPMNASRDITMSEAISAAAVPEPSAFVTVGMISLVIVGIHWFRRQR